MKIRPCSFRGVYIDVSISSTSHTIITSFIGVGFALDESPMDMGCRMISPIQHFYFASSSFSNSRWINIYFLIVAKYA